MSDNYLRLIPTDPTWTPDAEAAQRATAVLSALAPLAYGVEFRRFGGVHFVDQGSNLSGISCPACVQTVETDWWSREMDRSFADGFTDLRVRTPCCGADTTLNDLVYDGPAGFASAELSVVNPGRFGLDEHEIAQVAAELGHPLRQVLAHY